MTTPTEALKNGPSRRRLITVVLGLVLILILIRFFVLPLIFPSLSGGRGDLVARFIESGGVVLLTGLFIPIMAIWLGPDVKEKTLISILDRKLETDPAFEAAFQKIEKWYFRGGLGSYFRATTLPRILKQQPMVDVAVVLLDFRNSDLMLSYAAYRTALGGKKLTGEDVRNNIIETVGCIIKAANENSGVFSRFRIALVDNYSSFRIDLSDSAVLLTQDSPKAPAIRFDSDSSFYKGFENDFMRQLNGAVNIMDGQYKHLLVDPSKFISSAFI